MNFGGLGVGFGGMGRGVGQSSPDPAGLAKQLLGTFLEISSGTCFQERSATPTTPSASGDLVGCVKGRDGVNFAIATADNQRATLRQDECGHYYLDATGSAYIVQNSGGTKLALGTAYTHIGGWMGSSGTAFSTANDGSNRARILIQSAENFGNRTGIAGPVSGTNFLFNNTDDPTMVPHVLRVVKSQDTALGYYNNSNVAGNSAVDCFDTTATAQGLALFLSRYGNVVPAFGGRFYGGFWAPGTLSSSEKEAVVGAVMSLTIPGTPTGYTLNTNPVILGFTESEFEWGGVTKALSDLTDNGDGTYALGYINWWGQTHFLSADVEVGASTQSGVMVALASNNTKQEQIQAFTANPDIRNGYQTAGQWVTPDENGPFYLDYVARQRVGYLIKPGQKPRAWVNRVEVDMTSSPVFVPVLPPSSVMIGKDAAGSNLLTNITLHRAAFFGGEKTDAEILDIMSDGIAEPIHELGDSFVPTGSTTRFSILLQARIKAETPGFIAYSQDGVGGANLLEHLARFSATPQFYDCTLILNEGALEVSTLTQQEITDSLTSIFGLLTHNRYIYMESNPINPIGDSRRTTWETVKTAVISTVGATHYVPTLEAMFAANDGTGTDIAIVATGLWPAALTSDGTHYTEAGRAIWAKAAHGFLKDLGYVPGSTSLSIAPQNLVATPASTQITLTWDAPSNDGGHPVLGYLVEQETSPGSGVWNALAATGSPTGYTKQYIRSRVVTGLTNGTLYSFRVKAITAKGNGTAASVQERPSAQIWETLDFNTGWSFSGGASVSTNTTLTDDSAVSAEQAEKTATVVSGVAAQQFFEITKDATTSRFVGLYAAAGGSTYLTHINTSTGAVTNEITTLSGTTTVTDMGSYWLVRRIFTPGATTLTNRIYPARGNVFGSLNSAATGSVTVTRVEVRQ